MRARGYVRESTERQAEKFGPDAQRAAIRRACAELGLTLDEQRWYVDLLSGTGRVVRDELARAIEDARQGRLQVLVCYDTSRFARSERLAFAFEDELQRAGARVYYVLERIWADDEDQAMSKGMFHVMSAQYSRTLARKVRDGYAAKFARLGVPGGTAPWGYRFDQAARRMVLTEDAAIRALALRLYGGGDFSSRSLAEELNHRGHRIYGRPFTQWSIVEILRNPIAIGVTRRYAGRAGELLRDDVVAPIVDRETWDRCQELRAQRRVSSGPTRAGVFVLARIAVHAPCGLRLWGHRARLRAGHDRRLIHARGTSCTVSFHRDELPLELDIADWIASWRLGARQRARVAAFLGRERPDAAQRRAAIERRLERAKQLYLLGDLDEPAYAHERERSRKELNALPAPREAAPILHRIEDLARAWPKASLEARRALMEELCERVVVGDGTMELVVRERYRSLIAAIAEPFRAGRHPAPDRLGRGRWSRQEPARWARRGARPRHPDLAPLLEGDLVTEALERKRMCTRSSCARPPMAPLPVDPLRRPRRRKDATRPGCPSAGGCPGPRSGCLNRRPGRGPCSKRAPRSEPPRS